MAYQFNIKDNYKAALLIILLTAVLRIYFSEQSYYGISTDPANFILAVQSYNIAKDQPHLPGYYMHVQIIRLIKILTGNTHSAMIILSIFYSSVAMGFLYLLFRNWFDINISLLLALLVATNPMVWFYGCTTEIYSFDLFFSIVIAWLGLNPVGIYLIPLFAGLFSGVRPSSGILILGLYLFLWYRHIKSGSFSLKKAVFSHLAGLAGFLIWFIPMISSAGGIRKYLTLYSVNSPVPKISILQNWYTISSYIVFLLFPYVVLMIYLLIHYIGSRRNRIENDNSAKIIPPRDFIYLMLACCILPLVFFFFYYYAKGYFLLCIVPVLSLIIIFIRKKKASQIILSFAILLQTAFFCLWPYTKPEPRLYFSPGPRQFSISKVWLERFNSVYLMSQSHIRSMEKSENEIGKLINFLSDSSNKLKNNIIFIDPTISIKARALQAEYPQLNFGALSFFKHDQYEIYNDTEVTIKNGLNKMIKESWIISRRSFIYRYPEDIAVIQNSGLYSLCRVQPGKSEKMAEVYSSLFLRDR